MRFRTRAAVKFKTKLRFNQHYIIINKEQSVLKKIIKLFSSGKNIITLLCFGCKQD